MFDLSVQPESVKAKLPKSANFGELYFCLQATIDWFLGCGVYSFSIAREKTADGDCNLSAVAVAKPKQFQFAPASSLAYLAESGYLPLLTSDLWDPAKQVIGETVMDMEDINVKEFTIADLSWSLSDKIVWFFRKGAKEAKFQGSTDRFQFWAKYGLLKKDFDDFTSNRGDTDTAMLISKLPS